MFLVDKAKKPPLDYIGQDPYVKYQFMKHKKKKRVVHDYREEHERNLRTNLLKNAVMTVWMKVKKRLKKYTLEEVISEVAKQNKINNDPYLRKKRKIELKKQRQEKIYQKFVKDHTAPNSFLKVDQFLFFHE